MTIMEPVRRPDSATPPTMERCEDPRLPDSTGRRCRADSPNPQLFCCQRHDHNGGFHYAFQVFGGVTIWWRWPR
jgi:hypothetical protein